MFKKILTWGNDKVEITAYESWVVRWHNVYRVFYGSGKLQEQAEVFTNKEDAELFVSKLKESFKLTKCEALCDYISIKKN